LIIRDLGGKETGAGLIKIVKILIVLFFFIFCDQMGPVLMRNGYVVNALVNKDFEKIG
jgi:hypothetical protein